MAGPTAINAYVNGSRILTLWRHLNVDPLYVS